jgi:hypothetical protein
LLGLIFVGEYSLKSRLHKIASKIPESEEKSAAEVKDTLFFGSDK